MVICKYRILIIFIMLLMLYHFHEILFCFLVIFISIQREDVSLFLSNYKEKLMDFLKSFQFISKLLLVLYSNKRSY